MALTKKPAPYLFIVTFLLTTTLLATITAAQIIPYNQNPKFNTDLNPKYNTRISPVFNFSINPKTNFSINPAITSRLNPDYTTSINPAYNSRLDPQYNADISPRFNTRLDPSFPMWKGKYLFDENEEVAGYISEASHQVLLFFDTSKKWTGYFVRAETNFNLFTLEGKWTGKYLCSDSGTGFNFFDKDGEWTKQYVK